MQLYFPSIHFLHRLSYTRSRRSLGSIPGNLGHIINTKFGKVRFLTVLHWPCFENDTALHPCSSVLHAFVPHYLCGFGRPVWLKSMRMRFSDGDVPSVLSTEYWQEKQPHPACSFSYVINFIDAGFVPQDQTNPAMKTKTNIFFPQPLPLHLSWHNLSLLASWAAFWILPVLPGTCACFQINRLPPLKQWEFLMLWQRSILPKSYGFSHQEPEQQAPFEPTQSPTLHPYWCLSNLHTERDM